MQRSSKTALVGSAEVSIQGRQHLNAWTRDVKQACQAATKVHRLGFGAAKNLTFGSSRGV